MAVKRRPRETKIEIDQEALAIETFIKEVMRRFPTRWMPDLFLVKETKNFPRAKKTITTWTIRKGGGA